MRLCHHQASERKYRSTQLEFGGFRQYRFQFLRQIHPWLVMQLPLRSFLHMCRRYCMDWWCDPRRDYNTRMRTSSEGHLFSRIILHQRSTIDRRSGKRLVRWKNQQYRILTSAFRSEGLFAHWEKPTVLSRPSISTTENRDLEYGWKIKRREVTLIFDADLKK